MAYDELTILKASGAVTDGDDGGTTGLDVKTTATRGMTAVATVTAVAGTTPSLALEIQESANNSDWNTVAAFEPIDAEGEYRCRFATSKRYLRTFSTVTGSAEPSFTYSVNVTL